MGATDSVFTPFPVSKVGILSNGNARWEIVFWVFHGATALDFLPAEPHLMGSHRMIETICYLIRKSDHVPLKACIQEICVGDWSDANGLAYRTMIHPFPANCWMVESTLSDLRKPRPSGFGEWSKLRTWWGSRVWIENMTTRFPEWIQNERILVW
jgi:hypothetical protein